MDKTNQETEIDQLYKENAGFLVKGLFGVSAIGIPLLLKLILTPSFNKTFHVAIFFLVFMPFVASVIFQFLSLCATDVCLYYYDSMNNKKTSTQAGSWAKWAKYVTVCLTPIGLFFLLIIIGIHVLF